MTEPASTTPAAVAPHDHPAALAWAACVGHPVRPRSVTALKDTHSSAVYRLEGVGPGGAPVVAKQSRATTLGVERFLYETVLPRVGLPVYCALYGSLGVPDESEGGGRAWLFLEDAGDAPYDPDDPAHRALASRWLGAVHTATAGFGVGDEVPRLGPGFYREQLCAARGRISEGRFNPALDAAGRAVLDGVAAWCDRIARRWGLIDRALTSAPQCLVHGDYVPKNLRTLPAPGGPALLVFDWEVAGWGAPAADLGECPDLAAYAAAVRTAWPGLGPAAVDRLAACGRVCRWVLAVGWSSWRLSGPWPDRPMAQLRYYLETAPGLDDAFKA